MQLYEDVGILAGTAADGVESSDCDSQQLDSVSVENNMSPSIVICDVPIDGMVEKPEEHVTVEAISAEELNRFLTEQPSDTVLVDCRPYLAYSACHVVGSVNVCYPSLLERRRQRRAISANDRGKAMPPIPLSNIIRCEKIRQKVVNGCYPRLILYDENSETIDCSYGNKDRNSRKSESQISAVLHSLLLCSVNCRIYYLQGGFQQFLANFPGHVRSDHWPAESPPHACLRLCHSDTQRCHPSSDQGDPIEVLPWLYLGNAYHASCADRLEAHGISALLNMADTACDDVTVGFPDTNHQLCHLNIAIADNSVSDISACFPQAINFIENVRASGGKLLIHCRAGISRSATVCIAYLMYAGRLSLDDAYDYLKHRRPLISPNLNFMRQLAELEVRLKNSTAPSLDGSYDEGLPPPANDLISYISTYCGKRLKNLQSGGTSSCPLDLASPASASLECGGVGTLGRKRKLLDIKTPLVVKAPRSVTSALQPPPTPCTKQAFVFDIGTVAMIMSGHGNPGNSPNVCHSPLVSPS